MKRLTHKPRILFATNFSWWFGSPETGLAAGFSRASQASRSPAEAGSQGKILATQPPTEVGYVFSVADELPLGGMGKYSCPWAVPSYPHGQEYLPMPPRCDCTLNTYEVGGKQGSFDAVGAASCEILDGGAPASSSGWRAPLTARQPINFLRRAVLARIPRQRLLFGWHGQVILPVGNPIRSTRASVLAHATPHLGAFVSLRQFSRVGMAHQFGCWWAMPTLRLVAALVMLIGAGAGCQASRLSEESIETLRRQALVSLKLAASTASDPHVRVRALEGLRYAGTDGADLWIRQGLYDDDPAVRSAALRGLADLSPTDSVDAFDRWSEDGSPLVRAAALWPMRASDPARFGEQLRSLVLESPELRCQPEAFELLLSVCTSATEEELRDWLAAADPQETVFIRAVRGALVMQADARTMGELIQQARTGSSAERRAAIDLLALSAEPDVLYILLECLEEGESIEVRLAAARGLGRFGSKAGLKLALRHLKQAPGSGAKAVGQRLGGLQVLACEACAEIGDAKALPALGDLLAEAQDPEIRASCSAAVLRLIEVQREARR